MEEMVECVPLVMSLQPYDYCNKPSWVTTDLIPRDFMYLTWWWKSFALARGFKEGHVIHFKFDGVATLFVKTFG